MVTTYRNLTDEDLYQLMVIKQDREAFELLFNRYKHLALGVCVKYLSDIGWSKDAVQDVFFKMWHDAGKYKVYQFKPWFYTVVKNHCLSILRQKDPTKISKELTAKTESVEWTDYLHLKLNEEELLKHLAYCMKQLGEAQYRCIDYFYLKEKSYQEIALEIGYTYKEVKSHIQNGRKNLKTCMKTVIS